MFKSVREILKAHEPLSKEVYLDLENSNPIFPEVVEEIIPYFYKKAYGNPTYPMGSATSAVFLKATTTLLERGVRQKRFLIPPNL